MPSTTQAPLNAQRSHSAVYSNHQARRRRITSDEGRQSPVSRSKTVLLRKWDVPDCAEVGWAMRARAERCEYGYDDETVLEEIPVGKMPALALPPLDSDGPFAFVAASGQKQASNITSAAVRADHAATARKDMGNTSVRGARTTDSRMRAAVAVTRTPSTATASRAASMPFYSGGQMWRAKSFHLTFEGSLLALRAAGDPEGVGIYGVRGR
ncbi:hypothetical protein K438DRAFT_1773694 [Mycena galopus ATCC 62051]|nr:hypothetical protein K438DRAFT_1773694 [Mycena galopus ATCC 62051]